MAAPCGLALKGQQELVFYTDGDAQYDPNDSRLLMPEMKPGIDIVNGYKISRSDPLTCVIRPRMYHHFVRLLFGFKLRDVDCDFRLIRRSVFDVIDLESPDGTICLELVKKLQDAGYPLRRSAGASLSSTYGKSQFFNFRRLRRIPPQLARLWWKLVVRRSICRVFVPASGASVPRHWPGGGGLRCLHVSPSTTLAAHLRRLPA